MPFEIVYKIAENIAARRQAIELRKAYTNKPMIKVAFDTRRINQETEFNPRRGLQNYHRSESFITESTSNKLKVFKKLQSVLMKMKLEFEKSPEWQDSYARVLLNSLDRGLRTIQQDEDYSDTQPGVGSFDYLEELLYVRYRLSIELLEGMKDDEIRNTILGKDSNLTRPDVVEDKKEVQQQVPYDILLEKLFGGIKATKDNPEVERSVTITIKDSFKEKKK